MRSDEDILKDYQAKSPWGLHLVIDLSGCDPGIISSGQKIKDYVIKLCQLIDMKRFKDTTVIHFGDDPRISGFSMTQLIETSLISGHFAETSNSAYIDIFSCKYYPPQKAAEFTKNFFKAREIKTTVVFRG